MAPGCSVLFQYGVGEKGKGVTKDGKRGLATPRGMHVTEDGTLFVADFDNNCVVRFAPSDCRGQVVAGEVGKVLQDVDYLKDIDKPLAPAEGEGFLLRSPIGVALDSEGELLVLDCGKARIQSIERKQGDQAPRTTTVVPHRNSAPTKSAFCPESLKHPRAMLRKSDGSLIICDTWSHRVLCYPLQADAGPLTVPEPPVLLAGVPNSTACTAEKLSFPSCVVIAPDGALLVSDTNNHRIQRFEPGQLQGKTVAGSESGNAGASPSELNMPTGLCVDADGSIFVADRMNSRILRFDSSSVAGTAGEVIAGPDVLDRPWGLALGADGTIFVSDERRAVVLKLEVNGVKRIARPSTTGGYAAPDPNGLD
eukprot:TRINITY_DN90632_c0_g1_i1.p1 TRINITY_DN90632_c0_g1~~TRINITY_DN90632_c0_g1_i1.p1  ORF type:complete len:391 (-),score=74.37 TRINITY_DN90632_c0_g1_i1:59-1156(-)